MSAHDEIKYLLGAIDLVRRERSADSMERLRNLELALIAVCRALTTDSQERGPL